MLKESYLVDLGKHLHLRAVQDPEGQANHLQILTAGGRRNVSRFGPHIVDDTPLQNWDKEVRALVDDFLLHTTQSVEDHGASASLDIVHGILDTHSN